MKHTEWEPGKRHGYRFGVDWIALNDNPGEDDSEEDISIYVTTMLLADLFGKDPETVGRDIYARRVKLLAKRDEEINELRKLSLPAS